MQRIFLNKSAGIFIICGFLAGCASSGNLMPRACLKGNHCHIVKEYSATFDNGITTIKEITLEDKQQVVCEKSFYVKKAYAHRCLTQDKKEEWMLYLPKSKINVYEPAQLLKENK